MIDIIYNPKKLEDLFGLDYIKSAFANYKLGLPLMFEGPKGTGKTTIAHILADKFGASKENVRDVNCGYLRKIDDARGEIDSLNTSSFFGIKKVLILDEVHQLTSEAQQAWLKPLESDNLNPNVLVLACTTTTEKLLDTFLRRFKRFKVVSLSQKESKDFITYLCKQNNVTINKMVKDLIIKESEGIPGLILNNLSKVAGVQDENEIKYILEVAKYGEDTDLLEFIKKLMNKNMTWENVRTDLSRLYKTKTPNEIRIGLINLLSARVMSPYLKDGDIGNINNLFHYLRIANGIPEKAQLTMALFNYKEK